MYIMTQEGIIEVPKQKPFIKRLFCKHKVIVGNQCSKQGLLNLSGDTRISACANCGKILSSYFIKHD